MGQYRKQAAQAVRDDAEDDEAVQVIIKMFDRAPWGDIAGAAFGNEGVDVGIPF